MKYFFCFLYKFFLKINSDINSAYFNSIKTLFFILSLICLDSYFLLSHFYRYIFWVDNFYYLFCLTLFIEIVIYLFIYVLFIYKEKWKGYIKKNELKESSNNSSFYNFIIISFIVLIIITFFYISFYLVHHPQR